LKLVVGGIALITLIVLVFLITRINSLSSQLREANAQIEDSATDALGDFYRSEYERIARDLEIANATINSLTSAASDAPEDTSPVGGASEQPAESSTAETPGTSIGSTRMYVVVSGDTLSRIAHRFYGNSSQANIDRIKNANNKTSDRINIGDVLEIPE
jgi:nucleoid-associated protein YgaU